MYPFPQLNVIFLKNLLTNYSCQVDHICPCFGFENSHCYSGLDVTRRLQATWSTRTSSSLLNTKFCSFTLLYFLKQENFLLIQGTLPKKISQFLSKILLLILYFQFRVLDSGDNRETLSVLSSNLSTVFWFLSSSISSFAWEQHVETDIWHSAPTNTTCYKYSKSSEDNSLEL